MILSRLPYHLAAALMLLALPAAANVLLPGGTVAPDVFGFSGNPPVLGDITGTFNLGNGVVIGHWEEAVLVDPLSTPTVCAGCLDFAFQIIVDSSASGAGIFSANFGRFFDYTTDVGYVPDSGGVAPNSVSRGPFGGGVTFLFNTAETAIGLGRESDFAVVASNATTFDRKGSLAIAGGDRQNPNLSGQINELFEPTFIAPEPASWALMLAGAAALGLMRRRR
jgi:hypothetical protein